MAVLLGLYYLLFEREKMHRFNRFYLLGGLLFSLVLPFISLPTVYNKTILQDITLIPLVLKQEPVTQQTNQNPLQLIVFSIYLIIAVVLLIRFFRNIAAFSSKIKSGKTIPYKNAILVLLDEDVLPHTFLNYIFLNAEDYYSKTIENELYTHEMAHVNQKHTLDIIFIELLKIVFWFNPLLYFYKKSIQLNHEFLADENVIKTYNHAASYQKLLLIKASGTEGLYLASNLNFSLTKKRFIMMTKKTNRAQVLIKQALVLPLIAVMVLISCNNAPETIEKTDNAIYNTGLEKQPEFPGGLVEFYKYVNKNFTIPEINKDLTAKIYVSFVIEKDGTISDIKVLRDPGYGLGEEAKRVMESIDQKWTPAIKDGQPVRASYNLPITINIKS